MADLQTDNFFRSLQEQAFAFRIRSISNDKARTMVEVLQCLSIYFFVIYYDEDIQALSCRGA